MCKCYRREPEPRTELCCPSWRGCEWGRVWGGLWSGNCGREQFCGKMVNCPEHSCCITLQNIFTTIYKVQFWAHHVADMGPTITRSFHPHRHWGDPSLLYLCPSADTTLILPFLSVSCSSPEVWLKVKWHSEMRFFHIYECACSSSSVSCSVVSNPLQPHEL